MDFSVEHGFPYLRILPGNEKPVWCANSNYPLIPVPPAKTRIIFPLFSVEIDSLYTSPL
jgi:hypothetical protein